MTELIYKDEYYRIVNAAIEVWKRLGYGFLEKVYENALIIELQKRGFEPEQQKKFTIRYDGLVVGEYCSDLIVNNIIIIELKSARNFAEEHVAQVINYLKASTLRLGILLNFGPNGLEHKRIVF